MTKPITCIITDDEPMARKGLKSYIAKVDFLSLTGECEDALQLNSMLKQQPADLLFLDIEMPYISGIEFLKSTPNPPKVIFTTAYERYALPGYELDILDYLLKPLSFERFLKAANKAHDFFRVTATNAAGYLFIKTDSRLEKVNFDEILFLEAMENYVGIYTPGKKMITHATLRSMQEKLPAGFVQTHKSYIVNPAAIQSIEGNTLNIGSYQVPISKYQKEEAMEKILNNKILKK